MNIAVIFAGGRGDRLHSHSRPKQFFEFRGKPIVVYTIEVFQHIQEVDAIVVACLEDWIPYLRRQVEKYDLNKVIDIVPGGRKGQDSIYQATFPRGFGGADTRRRAPLGDGENYY